MHYFCVFGDNLKSKIAYIRDFVNCPSEFQFTVRTKYVYLTAVPITAGRPCPFKQSNKTDLFQTFLQLSNAATPSGAFFTYCGITFLGMVYFYIFLPETKGMSLDNTEQLFKHKRVFIGLKAGYERDRRDSENRKL